MTKKYGLSNKAEVRRSLQQHPRPQVVFDVVVVEGAVFDQIILQRRSQFRHVGIVSRGAGRDID